MSSSPIIFYNTATRRKETFTPIDPTRVRMYACGPTVYDYAHIGNGRTAVTFDLVFRLLRYHYGADHVIYVRNFTDVEDKIMARAKERGVPIAEITEPVARIYQEDMYALGNIAPSIEPRATAHIGDMIEMIETLIEKGHAYVAEGHVLFSVQTMDDYGKLSGRSVDEMIAGARVDVAPYKKDPMDFVLWKPSDEDQPGWDSPWGVGRPGWHIECSAMSAHHLGTTFDLHGGGIDLTFPHHENEIAQSHCAHDGVTMANVWMHGGYLQVDGQKMSKSLGNFLTVHDLIETWPGEALRLHLLMTHYRQPLNWTEAGVREAKTVLDRWYRLLDGKLSLTTAEDMDLPEAFVTAFSDDVNTPQAIAVMHELAHQFSQGDDAAADALIGCGQLLGLFGSTAEEWAKWQPKGAEIDPQVIEDLISARNAARSQKNFKEADRIRDELKDMGVVIEDGPNGTTWRTDT